MPCSPGPRRCLGIVASERRMTGPDARTALEEFMGGESSRSGTFRPIQLPRIGVFALVVGASCRG